MKTQLYAKCLTYDFKTLFEKKSYAYFTKGDYNLNIIGIRTKQNNKVTNKFDDFLILDYNENNKHIRKLYKITTEPGITYMNKPSVAKGTAILVPGQYRNTYAIGLHNGKYEALCQKLKPVKVYRDSNKDDIYDMLPETVENGMFGINIHRSSSIGESENINNYSAGCQVFANINEFTEFMKIVNKAKLKFGNSFTYTLINEEDIV